jgi:hypothetical protein
MRMRFNLAAISVAIVCCVPAWCQAPSLVGTWKADLTASKIGGPPLKDYVEIIEQKGTRITERVGQLGEHGEQRSELSFTSDGTPTIRPYMGVPCRETAVTDATGLTLTIETAGRPDIAKRQYVFTNDGKTLTITTDSSANGHQMHNVVVLNRADEGAAEWLTKPEPLASEHMKNVKTPLKDLPTSQFIDQMHYFAWALNKDCEFCHVRGKFDSDDKEEKRTARQMIAMVGTVDEKYFEGKPRVTCFTCHEFRNHPLSRPRFEGEPEHHHESAGGNEHEHGDDADHAKQ